MGFKDMFNKIKENRRIDIDDDKTTDHYLRFLRRESRRIDEKREKTQLKLKIKNEDFRMRRENVYGMGNSILKAKNIYQEKFKYEPYQKEKSNILKAKNNFKTKKYNLKV